MQIDIISVGSIKEKYAKDAILDYITRINRFCKVCEIVVKDESNSLNESQVLQKEAVKILEKLKENTYLIVLDIDGKMLTSTELSEKVNNIQVSGYSHITFLIGGSLGIDKSIKDKANFRLSFSKMTFPHQLFKVILLEQIYRSFKINNNQKYHK